MYHLSDELCFYLELIEEANKFLASNTFDVPREFFDCVAEIAGSAKYSDHDITTCFSYNERIRNELSCFRLHNMIPGANLLKPLKKLEFNRECSFPADTDPPDEEDLVEDMINILTCHRPNSIQISGIYFDEIDEPTLNSFFEALSQVGRSPKVILRYKTYEDLSQTCDIFERYSGLLVHVEIEEFQIDDYNAYLKLCTNTRVRSIKLPKQAAESVHASPEPFFIACCRSELLVSFD